jgi:hypothetical protein
MSGINSFFQRQESTTASVIQGILSVRILILIYLVSVDNFDSMRVGILSVRILILIYLVSVDNFDSMRVTLVYIESHWIFN